jgi:regulatory protein
VKTTQGSGSPQDEVASGARPAAATVLARALRKKAMDLLARREHTAAELQRKLQAHGRKQRDKGHGTKAVTDAAADDIAEMTARVIASLQAEGLVSDERFTEAYVRYRMTRGYGPQRIQAELRERGVDDKIQALYLDAGDCQWLEQVAQVRRKRFGETPPDDYKERARQARFLQYRGFTADQIREVLDG